MCSKKYSALAAQKNNTVGYNFIGVFFFLNEKRQKFYKRAKLLHVVTTLKINFSDLSNPIKLGEGTFGEVFRISYKGEIVALKVRFKI